MKDGALKTPIYTASRDAAHSGRIAETCREELSIAVIVPCYNEELSVGKVVSDFRAQLPTARIYAYDNNSSDRTREIAREAGAIVRSEPRQGCAGGT